jgi:Peptidase M15.
MLSAVALLLFALAATGCSSSDDADDKSSRLRNQKGEYIYRTHNESFFNIPPPQAVTPKPYPWELNTTSNYPKITKEHFRCKGNSLNPSHANTQNNGGLGAYDCGGTQKHGLPLRDGKEFIYPVLIDLLNYIQDTTGKKVVVTCGHRCPEHNAYVDPSTANQYSKHTIGAEVTFYVQGLENQPEKIVDLIQNYYKISTATQGKKDFEVFQRYDKSDANVSIQPWFNKEVFVKISSKFEGRNLDNNHPYPYVSIQVRFDRDLNEKVAYSWDKASRNYHRK